MDNSSFYSRYADLILSSALKIKKGDVLSINTEEEDYAFARIISEKAKAVTGNGSYIQLLKDGRIVSQFDILSSFPLTKEPNVFLYISYFKSFEEVERERLYEARELQRFSLLSDPLDNPLPSSPFVKVYLPSKEWDEKTESNDWALTSRELLSSILNLEDDDYLRTNNLISENILYKTKCLNRLGLREGRIADDEGTNLTFTFLPGSEFISSYSMTADRRPFSPSLISRDIFRLIDPYSLSGYLNITRPVLIFGVPVTGLSFYFEKGKVVSVSGSRKEEELFYIYSSQDENALRASMLTLNEADHPLFDMDLTYISEYDRMRTVSITIGGPRGEAVKDIENTATVDSLLTLNLPIGSKSLVVTALDKDGNEWTLYENGFILEEDFN